MTLSLPLPLELLPPLILLPLPVPPLLLTSLPLFMSPLVPNELHAAKPSAARPVITNCITFIRPPLPEKSGQKH
jgi:hypothetical protein